MRTIESNILEKNIDIIEKNLKVIASVTIAIILCFCCFLTIASIIVLNMLN